MILDDYYITMYSSTARMLSNGNDYPEPDMQTGLLGKALPGCRLVIAKDVIFVEECLPKRIHL
jgi:hypothetical protein